MFRLRILVNVQRDTFITVGCVVFAINDIFSQSDYSISFKKNCNFLDLENDLWIEKHHNN